MDAVETAAAKLVRAYAARGDWDPMPVLCALGLATYWPEVNPATAPPLTGNEIHALRAARAESARQAADEARGRTRLSPEAVVGALEDPAVWRAIAEHAAMQALEHPAGWRSHRALTRLAAVASDLEDLLSANDSREVVA